MSSTVTITPAPVLAARFRRLGALAACALLGAFGLLAAGAGAAAAAPGDLDTTFGRGGWVETFPSDPAEARDLAIQADGKLVTVGEARKPSERSADVDRDFVIARYGTDGAPDTSFGPGGRGWSRINASAEDVAYGVAIQPDGKIVVAGSSTRVHMARLQRLFAVLRLLPNGDLDRGFGQGGIVRTELPGGRAINQRAFDVEVRADGKIIAAGEATIVSDLSEFGPDPNAAAIARYNRDGSFDRSFGSGGMVLAKDGRGTGARALALLSDGKLVTAGSSNDRIAVRRYSSNGSPDASFGSAGLVIGSSGTLNALLMQPDGKLVTGGEDGERQGVLLRLRPDGSLDPSFGSDGRAAVPPNMIWEQGSILDLALQGDGRIVSAGLDLLRFDTNGSHDRSFITRDGWEEMSWPANAVAVQASGRIVTAGDPTNGPLADNQWYLARFLVTGTRQPPLALSGRKIQRLGKTVKVKAACDGACTIYATGRLAIGARGGPAGKLRLRPATAQIAAGQTATLKLRVKKRTRRLASRALSRGKKVVAKIKADASSGGQNALASRTVRLRR